MASIISVPNETTSQISRMTKAGKRVTYRLNVIQQPERARACGSGAKSSADRRPVDPPPIVELRIFEGEDQNNLTDVTFSYNANYFLFATLENARSIAQGRVQTANTSFPVLTGTPVAGMAYLDRPNPAGYFIFPDLSVRHEGKYRLSFALYEELKNQGDMDADENQTVEVLQQAGYQAHVSHRLEVKSSPFTVFSAKKFPGLTESTSLSRMVAEQGCRVRIRRDVRMRRRDKNDPKDWDDYEDDTAAERARRTETPADYGQPGMPPAPYDGGRPKSASNASVHSMNDNSRRTSQQDLAQQYAHGYHMQPQQQGGYPGSYPNGQVQGYPNHFQQPQAIMQPPQTPYQGSQHGYQGQQNYGYPPPQNYGQQHYEQQQQQGHARHESMEYASSPADYRRPPVPQQQGPQYHSPQVMNHYGNESYSRPPSQAMQPPQSGMHQSHPTTPTSAHPPHSLAPLKTLQPPTEKIEPASPSYPVGPMSAPADGHYSEAHRAAPPSYSQQPQSATNKRSFGSTFDTKHIEQPLRHGARPGTISAVDELGGNLDDDDDQEIIQESAMRYRRADGTHRSRRVPQLGE